MLFSDKATALAHAQHIFPKGVPVTVHARIGGEAALVPGAFLEASAKDIQNFREAFKEAVCIKLAGKAVPKALAADLKKQEDNLVKLLVAAVIQGVRYTTWSGVANLRAELQSIAAAIREVVAGELSAENQASILNKVFGKVVGALFGSTLLEGVAPTVAESNELITLIAAMLAHAETPLQDLVFPEGLTVANVAFFEALVTEFFTHSAKHSHSAASFWGCFEVLPSGTGHLNGHELGETLLGASTGGGKLRDATWLLSLLTINLAEPDVPAIRVFDCLTSQNARDQLIAKGLSAVSLLPYCGSSSNKAFNGHLVPIIRFAVPGEEEGQALAVVPSNGMLKAMVELRDTLWARRGSRREALIRKQAAEISEQLDVAASEVEALVLAYHDEFVAPKRDKAREALRRHLQKLKPADLTKDEWTDKIQGALESTRAPVRRGARIVNIGIVGSQPQNVSSVYKDLAGSHGVPRFPAYRKSPLADSPLVRKFFGLKPVLRQRLAREVARAPASTLATYQVGSKWLPNRVQAGMRAKRVEMAVKTFMKVLNGLVTGFKNLSDDERLTCAAGARSALERYVLEKDVSPEVLAELSQEALVLASDASKAEREAIVETVKQRLKGA